MQTQRSWHAICFSAMICLGLAAGCSDEPFSMVPVKGSLLYEDGSPIDAARITVTFVPQAEPVDAKTYPLAGRAEIDVATGAFDFATSHRYGDGLIRGEHKVYLVVYPKDKPAHELLSPKYFTAENSPLSYHTDQGEFEIRIPRPD